MYNGQQMMAGAAQVGTPADATGHKQPAQQLFYHWPQNHQMQQLATPMMVPGGAGQVQMLATSAHQAQISQSQAVYLQPQVQQQLQAQMRVAAMASPHHPQPQHSVLVPAQAIHGPIPSAQHSSHPSHHASFYQGASIIAPQVSTYGTNGHQLVYQQQQGGLQPAAAARYYASPPPAAAATHASLSLQQQHQAGMQHVLHHHGGPAAGMIPHAALHAVRPHQGLLAPTTPHAPQPAPQPAVHPMYAHGGATLVPQQSLQGVPAGAIMQGGMTLR